MGKIQTKFESKAHFSVSHGPVFMGIWADHFADHGYETISNETSVLVKGDFGSVILNVDDKRVDVHLTISSLGDLVGWRDAITSHLAAFDANLENLLWSGFSNEGALLPNFRFATVKSCEKLNHSFYRMVLSGGNLECYAKDQMHFRLLRQANNDAPEIWPRMGPNGTAVWPKDEDQLVHNVYTVRHYDTVTSELTFDIFDHFDGRTCEWAKSNPVGQRVGMVGPGGGATPIANWVLLAGDETALPAILRMLEELPNSTVGQAFIQIDTTADIIAFDNKTQVQLNWLLRGDGKYLCEEVKKIKPPNDPSIYYWFAGSQKQARDIRDYFRNTIQLNRTRFSSTAYWR